LMRRGEVRVTQTKMFGELWLRPVAKKKPTAAASRVSSALSEAA